ncbi:MAG: SUMF1/EgtB/PvdO family nonheme iron enzyme [Proteobacteria bacterium]|nr:SUMF1/EgtB/PvdO family nonheme iron enzyme [Pseudomonadota bacterium]
MTKQYGRGDVIASRFEVRDLLGESPLGASYRVTANGTAQHLLVLRAEVATKAGEKGLARALKRAKGLSDGNILAVQELVSQDGIVAFVCEDFEGQTLRQFLQESKVEGKQLEAKAAAQIVGKVLGGLEAAHTKSAFARALRPEYVLVHARRTGPGGKNLVATIKLLYLGLWDLVDANALSEDEFARGEAQYMAPELKGFEPRATPRCDVYSAGVLFYELLTGSPPVGTFQMPTTIRPELPKHVNNVVELAIANAPEDRYQSARDMRVDVERTFKDAAMLEEREKKPLITWIGWVAVAMLVIVAGVLAYLVRPDAEMTAQARDAAVKQVVLDGRPEVDAATAAKLIAANPSMVYVPGGTYLHGRLHAEEDASMSEPLADVRELPAFLMDAYEWPNKAGERPEYGMTYDDARASCEGAGKRLCSAEEWEKACKGPLSSVYSYGDFFDVDFCGDGVDNRGYPSGARKDCRSDYGAFDLSGNFAEWTGSAPKGKDTRRLVKGGQRGNARRGTRCAFSNDESIALKDNAVSFRCCKSP